MPHESDENPELWGYDTPTAIERLAAAFAYLGVFCGLWGLAPLVVFVAARKRSPFVREHSFQALMLAVWTVWYGLPAFVGACILGLVVWSLDNHGYEGAKIVVTLVVVLLVAFVAGAFLFVSVIGGLKALLGSPWSAPLVRKTVAAFRARRARR